MEVCYHTLSRKQRASARIEPSTWNRTSLRVSRREKTRERHRDTERERDAQRERDRERQTERERERP
jgi:hypothetical protein